MCDEIALKDLKEPTVLKGRIEDWACRNWTLENWAEKFGSLVLKFRVGSQQPQQGPTWEGDCDFLESSLQDFVKWQKCELSSSPQRWESALTRLDPKQRWIYADYKHLAHLFEDDHEIIQSVDWGPLGFEGCKGGESTIWIGSCGANTPCHFDTYGYNMVAQLVGRKRWFLFPPGSTDSMYPTRIPYEESSVFSLVDIKRPDLEKFPKFLSAEVRVVTLEPGDVLVVPHQWWHFVESLQTSISINCWKALEVEDKKAHLEEAVTRTMVFAFMGVYNPLDTRWLNPTEEEVDPEVNLRYVKESLERCLRDPVEGSSGALSAKGEGQPKAKKKKVNGSESTVYPMDFQDYLRLLDCGLQGRAITADLNRSIRGIDEPELGNILLNAILHPSVIGRACTILSETISRTK